MDPSSSEAHKAPELPDSSHVDDRLLAEARSAEVRYVIREAGRKKAGTGGAMMAGVMLALQEIYEAPVQEEVHVIFEASGEPHDLETDGVQFSLGDVDVTSTPIPQPSTNDSDPAEN